MMRLKTMTGAAALSCVALVAAGCGSSKSKSSASSSSSATSTSASATTSASSSAAASSSGKKYTVALVPGDSTDPFYLSMKSAGAAEAAKLGMKFVWQGASTFSPEAQQPVLQSLLAKKPSALLVAPTDPSALDGVLTQFHAGGTPIITVDTALKSTSILTAAITSDNQEGGAAAADACGAKTGGKGAAAVIYTTPGTTTTNLRGQGFIAEMKKKYPDVKTYTEYDNNEESTASSQVSSLLLGHSDLNCIFGTNDYAAEGAAQAVDNSGKASKVTIAGYDAEPQLVALLKKGTIQIIIAQKPAEEATTAVMDAYDALTGKKSSITKSVQLPNVVMTKQNINEPSISQWIYK